MNLPESNLVKTQYKNFEKIIHYDGRDRVMQVLVRYDDECGNGHNTFAITAQIGRGKNPIAFGCLHDEIEKFFPELAHLIKWHLVSSEGPMHYIANTVYHVKKGNLEFARNTAVWQEAIDEDLSLSFLEHDLNERLPALMAEFKTVIESLGFTY